MVWIAGGIAFAVFRGLSGFFSLLHWLSLGVIMIAMVIGLRKYIEIVDFGSGSDD